MSLLKRSIQINSDIPGYKNEEQLYLLGNLVRRLPLGSTIVELGACAGRGTWTIAQNAPWFSTVYAIDWWYGERVFAGYGYALDPSARDSKEYFLGFVRDHGNIQAIQGDAKDVPFDHRVDCLIIDADWGHNKNNHYPIWEKWRPRLNNKALVIGANYYPDKRHDEVKFADHVGKDVGNLEHQHGIWWCRY